MPPLFQRLKNRLAALLRKTEHITKTDNVYLAKNSFFVSFNQAVSVLTGFGLYILIARLLPKEVYGQYKYLLSLFGLFSIAGLSGMESALSRSIANGHDGSLTLAFKRKWQGALVGSAISLCAGAYYFYQGNAFLGQGLTLLAIFAPWIYAANVYGAFFTGKRQFGLYTKTTSLLSLLAFCGMAAAFILVKNPTWLFFFFLITSSTNLIGYSLARRRMTNHSVDTHMVRYGIHLSLIDVFGIVANSIDSVLAFHFLGAAPLAVYSLAIIPVEQLKGFLKSVPSIASPKFSVRALTDIRQNLWRKVLLYSAATAGAVLIYIMLAHPFFAIFFPSYLSSVPYSQIYSLSLLCGMPATLLLTLFTAKGLKKEITLFNVVSYSAQIILLVIGVTLYGLWGLIVSRILSRGIMLVTATVMLYRAEEAPVLHQG